MADSEHDEQELDPTINNSESESGSDDNGSEINENDLNADESSTELNENENENVDDDLSIEELDDNDDNDDGDDGDENQSDSDYSDNDPNGRTSHTSSTKSHTYNPTNPTSTNKQNKKSNQPETINTDFNNPENTNYLEKLNNGMRDNFVITSHPESITHNYDDVKLLSQIKRNASGVIDDPKHRMIPFLTKYEMTRILGVRAQQIDNGAQPTITLDNPELISGYFIAKQEFSQNKLPFIIKRSFPGNGGVEYWNVCDLDVPFQY